MSRSGYSDDCDDWALIRWRGAVASAIRGKKGQAFLGELLAALDGLPEKKLIAHSFQEGGGVCTLGAVCATRGVAPPPVRDPEAWDDFDAKEFAQQALGIPGALAAEIMYLNDEGGWGDTPEGRWTRMREWVAEQMQAPTLKEGA